MAYSIEEITELLEDLQRQQQLLFVYAKELDLTMESVELTLAKICKGFAKVLQCERISIWLFNENQTVLRAENIYDSVSETRTSGQCLYKEDLPVYFSAIQRNRTVAVEDIAKDPVTAELYSKDYYSSNSISSMLDTSIILSRGLAGVLCCESVKKRKWTTFDKVAVSALADMLAFIFDRLYRIEIEEHVHSLAYTDQLTGLQNQHAFIENASSKLTEVPSGERAAFLYMVLDQFTEIQSVLGYEGGEEVLKEIAVRLTKLFPPPAVTARISFDHFIIYIPNMLNDTIVREKMMEMSDEIRRPMYVRGHEVYLTFSYGIAFFPDHVSDVKAGLQAAQVALEAGRKQSARKSGIIYKPGMHSTMKEMMQSEINLRKGLDLNEFLLYYQPQVDGQTGELRGFEALIRWNHPERGLIYPGEFIELAESTGLILPIGEWVIKEAFAQLARWKEEGVDWLTVSVNLSPRHFLHRTLPEYLHTCAVQYNVEPKQLKLEITEYVALQNQEKVQSRIKELTKEGFDISIDDFGTGYSAFVYLQHFAIQEIKIERQFITNIVEDEKSRAIVKTIIDLARLLRISVVAEGVETLEQWTCLQEFKCDVIQGFYFGKPMPAEKFNRLLSNRIPGKRICLPNANKLI